MPGGEQPLAPATIDTTAVPLAAQGKSRGPLAVSENAGEAKEIALPDAGCNASSSLKSINLS